jgi:hypothetical protein
VTIEKALYTYLSTYAGLVALIGKRVYPVIAPQETIIISPPVGYVVYQLIDDLNLVSGSGSLTVHPARFQFSCYGGGSSQYTNACAIADQMKLALRDYAGTMGGSGGVVVQRTLLEMSTDLYDENTNRCGRAVDFTIWHEGS